MKNLVMHRMFFDCAANLSQKARDVGAVITRLLEEDPAAIDWYDAEKPNAAVAELFKPGEEVTLYGCFKGHGACIDQAYWALTRKGVVVSYSIDGCL